MSGIEGTPAPRGRRPRNKKIVNTPKPQNQPEPEPVDENDLDIDNEQENANANNFNTSDQHDKDKKSNKRPRFEEEEHEEGEEPDETSGAQTHSNGYEAGTSHYDQVPSSRKTRVAEKHELASLNKRLELYILRVREREASSGGLSKEIDFIKSQYQTELNIQKQSANERIEQLRQQRTEQSNLNAQLNQEIKRLQDEIARLSAELSNESNARAAAEKRAKQFGADLQLAQDRLNRAEEDRNRLCIDVDTLRSENDNINSQLTKLQNQASQALNRAQIAEQTSANALADLALLKKSKDSEIASLTDQVDHLKAVNLKIEDSLRREFGSQLKDILSERQIQYEEEKERGLQSLREMYEERITECNTNNESLSGEIDSLTQALANEKKQRAQDRREFENFAAEKAAMTKKIEDLNQRNEKQQKDFEVLLFEKNEKAKEQQRTIARKDVEFQTLMDVKVALDMEIAAYRSLIENEEDRLGYQNTRSRNSNQGETSSNTKQSDEGRRRTKN